MKNKDKLIQIYKDKINFLKDHNYQYFILSKPKITDSEYDKLKIEVLEMEKKYPILEKFGSIAKIVGAPPSNKFNKIKHLSPMLSLSNAFNIKDMDDFSK